MKRHKSLIALSQDHHRGLLLSMLIKRDAPDYNGFPNDTDGKIEYTINAWESELKQHFRNEEEILFPFVSGRDESLDIMINEILIEHKEIENRVKQLKNAKEPEEILYDLGDLLEHHIRREERELFELIQHVFSDDELKILVNKIEPVK
jgi:iron-sulfur cluster repair protein YtfE (RIC family)